MALCNEVRKYYINNAMVAAKTGLGNQSQHPSIRSDYIFWLDEDSTSINIQAYFNQMHALRVALNQQLFMNLQSLETHLAVYPIGGFYQKHLDPFSHDLDTVYATKARQLSCAFYLNADWQADDGGELRLYLNEH